MEIRQRHGVLEWATQLPPILDSEPGLQVLAGQYLRIVCRTRFMLSEQMASLSGKGENILECLIILIILAVLLTKTSLNFKF